MDDGGRVTTTTTLPVPCLATVALMTCSRPPDAPTALLTLPQELKLDLIFGSGEVGGTRIQDVLRDYDSWLSRRKRAARRAKVAAASVLGSAGKVDAFMKELGRTRDGELEAESFVEMALSDAYFGSASSRLEPVAVRGEQGAPLLALVGLLPDEHTRLREGLLQELRGRLGGAGTA